LTVLPERPLGNKQAPFECLPRVKGARYLSPDLRYQLLDREELGRCIDRFKLPVAVRNPLEERALISIALEKVPTGFYVYFPHRWVWLDPRAERKLDLLVAARFNPRKPCVVGFHEKNDQHKAAPVASIRLYGRVPGAYSERLQITGVPASWMSPVGGVLARGESSRPLSPPTALKKNVFANFPHQTICPVFICIFAVIDISSAGIDISAPGIIPRFT
jgi:hypothetical protein